MLSYVRKHNRKYDVSRWKPSSTYGRKPWSRRVDPGREALRIARSLQRQKERRVGESTTTIATVTTTASVQLLNNLAQGDTSASRTGDKVTIKGYRARFILKGNSTATLTQLCRVLVIRWNQQQPSTDLPLTQALTSADMFGIDFNYAGFKECSVLYDKTFSVGINDGTEGGQANRKHFEIDLDFKAGFTSMYNGAASTAIQSNGLYLCVVGDEAVNGPSLYSVSNIQFTD